MTGRSTQQAAEKGQNITGRRLTQMDADKKTKNLHLSYRRSSALIGGLIALFSSLLGAGRVVRNGWRKWA
jgi:hypothetical protein